MHSFCFSKTTIPGCAGESKKAFAVSFERSGMVYNIKRCSTQREEPRLRGAGQAMQETEYSVPLERLAGRLPFQGLRRPPALPGACVSPGTVAQNDAAASGMPLSEGAPFSDTGCVPGPQSGSAYPPR